jgi:hypothetical protein
MYFKLNMNEDECDMCNEFMVAFITKADLLVRIINSYRIIGSLVQYRIITTISKTILWIELETFRSWSHFTTMKLGCFFHKLKLHILFGIMDYGPIFQALYPTIIWVKLRFEMSNIFWLENRLTLRSLQHCGIIFKSGIQNSSLLTFHWLECGEWTVVYMLQSEPSVPAFLPRCQLF